MNPLVRNLFHELADLPHEERERVLAEQGISPEIRAEVESLLTFDSPEVSANVHWGPYRRVRVLGAGGMGTVYLAERTDGEIQQQVAIKFLRDDVQRAAWRERFLQERQLLAYLNHPSIAHLIDAGKTKDGHPYLVMEYVDGMPIDEYSEGMELRDQLSLFLRVCDGVSHAHHRLIIHRDLKPSNILVDASGQPKLLDFGIAKLLDENRNRTLTIERVLTPNYASPEQIEGNAESTATDIYSLGAVLHKILRGYSPNESKESTANLPADLQSILRKALRTEPDERYSSVEALADDVRAFLDWRPVQARSGDTWYRTRKFLRRYWAPVSVTVLVIAGLAAGLYIVKRERDIAQRRFEQVRQLSNKVLALDATLATLPGSTRARNEIVAMSKEYLERMMAEGHADKDLTYELANAFRAVGEAEGVPSALNLGHMAQADESLVKADKLSDEALAASPNNRAAFLLSATINVDRMILADTNHRRDFAVALARRSADRLDALGSPDGLSDHQQREAGQNYINIALAYKNLHQYDESVRYGRRAVAFLKSTPGSAPGVASALSIIADSLRYEGDLEGALKTINEADAIVADFTFPSESGRANIANNLAWRRGMILGADGQFSLMRSEEAIAAFQRAFDITEEIANRDPQEASFRILFIQDGRELGNILRHQNPQRALDVFDHALMRVGEVKNNSKARRGEAQLLALSSYPLRDLKRTAEARQRIDQAIEKLRQTKDYPPTVISNDDEVKAVLMALGDHLAATGQTRQAEDTYEELLSKLMASHPDPDDDLLHAATLSRIYGALAPLQLRNGEPDHAKASSALRLKIWQTWKRKLPNNAFVQRELEAASS
jgi:tetratricopeptide (TPR) repeat protein